MESCPIFILRLIKIKIDYLIVITLLFWDLVCNFDDILVLQLSCKVIWIVLRQQRHRVDQNERVDVYSLHSYLPPCLPPTDSPLTDTQGQVMCECGKKPDHQEEIYVVTGRTCKLHVRIELRGELEFSE